MSPEQNIKRAGVFQKLAMRDKLEVSKKRQSLTLLTQEREKNQQIKEQLEELIEQARMKNDMLTGLALQSASWFSTQMRDQLEIITNRCVHLDREIEQLRQTMAQAERRRTKKTEKAAELFSQARRDRQDRQDAELNDRPRKR